MKKFLLGLLAGVVLTGMAAVIIVFAFARMGDRRPSVPSNATLVLRIDGDIPEQPGTELPFFLPGGDSPMTMHEGWMLFRKAAADPRIKAILLLPRNPGIGWAKLEELRNGILHFRKSGKPVYAWLHTPNSRDYYLASAADRIYMAPEDMVDVKGLRAELMFVKGTLDKLGVQAEIEHAGKYKDAGDMFTRTSATPETLEVINSMLDAIYGDLVAAIARDRKKTPEQIRSLIDQAPLLPQAAKSAGLIDDLLYEDQLEGELQKKLGQPRLEKISHNDYVRVPASSVGLEGDHRIALVVGQGAILRGEGSFDPFSGNDGIYSGSFIKLLRQVSNEDRIRGVIVRIDSPGGDALASDDILREIKLVAKKKPIVLSMSDLAASGGYYIAMTGDPVVAYSNTITGSIGVIFGKMNLRGLYDKIGVSKEILTRGAHAAIDSDYRPLDEPARQELREAIDHIYRGFVSRVAEARKRKYEQVEPLAQGRAWLGVQARSNGLVDELGGFDRAIELLKKRANIKPEEKIRIVTYPRRKSLIEALMERDMEGAAGLDSRFRELRALTRDLDLRLWSKGGLMRLPPYTIRVY